MTGAPASVQQWAAAQAEKVPFFTPLRESLVEPSPAAASVLPRGLGLPHEVRVPAIRDGHNYGWVQLPRGTWVELLAVEGDHAFIRYDESVVRLPMRATERGTVTLGKRMAPALRS